MSRQSTRLLVIAALVIVAAPCLAARQELSEPEKNFEHLK